MATTHPFSSTSRQASAAKSLSSIQGRVLRLISEGNHAVVKIDKTEMDFGSARLRRAHALREARNGGLTSQDAAMRLLKFGRNLLTPGDSGKGIRLFSHISLTASFLSAMYAALQCEGGLSSGEQQTTWLATLMPALALKAMLLCYARNLEGARNAAEQVMVSKVKVMRDGQQGLVDSNDLVPGDVLLLASGDRVPADCMVLSVQNNKQTILMDLSALVGPDHEWAKMELRKTDIAFMGSYVELPARGLFLVYATGNQTLLGRAFSEPTTTSLIKGSMAWGRALKRKASDILARTLTKKRNTGGATNSPAVPEDGTHVEGGAPMPGPAGKDDCVDASDSDLDSSSPESDLDEDESGSDSDDAVPHHVSEGGAGTLDLDLATLDGLVEDMDPHIAACAAEMRMGNMYVGAGAHVDEGHAGEEDADMHPDVDAHVDEGNAGEEDADMHPDVDAHVDGCHDGEEDADMPRGVHVHVDEDHDDEEAAGMPHDAGEDDPHKVACDTEGPANMEQDVSLDCEAGPRAELHEGDDFNATAHVLRFAHADAEQGEHDEDVSHGDGEEQIEPQTPSVDVGEATDGSEQGSDSDSLDKDSKCLTNRGVSRDKSLPDSLRSREDDTPSLFQRYLQLVHGAAGRQPVCQAPSPDISLCRPHLAGTPAVSNPAVGLGRVSASSFGGFAGLEAVGRTPALLDTQGNDEALQVPGVRGLTNQPTGEHVQELDWAHRNVFDEQSMRYVAPACEQVDPRFGLFGMGNAGWGGPGGGSVATWPPPSRPSFASQDGHLQSSNPEILNFNELRKICGFASTPPGSRPSFVPDVRTRTWDYLPNNPPPATLDMLYTPPYY